MKRIVSLLLCAAVLSLMPLATAQGATGHQTSSSKHAKHKVHHKHAKKHRAAVR